MESSAYAIYLIIAIDREQLKQCGTADDDMCVLQADKCDKQTDTNADCRFQILRDCIEDCFTHVCQGQNDEDDTFREDSSQSILPAVSHAEHDGISKVRIQSHTRCKGKRIVGKQRHCECTNKCSQCGCSEDSSVIHTGGRHDTWVDSQNVCHGHEACDSGNNLSFDICAVFFELEKFF